MAKKQEIAVQEGGRRGNGGIKRNIGGERGQTRNKGGERGTNKKYRRGKTDKGVIDGGNGGNAGRKRDIEVLMTYLHPGYPSLSSRPRAEW